MLTTPEPDCVFIETTTACTRSCPWCTRHYYEVRPEYMPEPLFMKIITDLGSLNFRGRLSLFQNGEPLIDDRLSRWLQISKQYCPDSFTLLFSNGDLLTPEKAIELSDSGLDAIKVNTYDTAAYTRALETISRLGHAYTKRIILEDYSERQDWSNRGGTVPFRNSRIRPDNAVCPRPFRQMYISWKGAVPQCCSDYLHKEIMGDVSVQSISDVWTGAKFSLVRESLLGNAPLNELCKACDLEPDYLTVSDIKALFAQNRR